MFLKAHVELADGFDAVRAPLLERPGAWLDGPGRDRTELLRRVPLGGLAGSLDAAWLAAARTSRFVDAVARRLTDGASGDQPRGTWTVSSPAGASKWRTSPRADLGTTNPTAARMCSDGASRSCGSPPGRPASSGS